LGTSFIINHLSQQQRYLFTAEHWGIKILSINWKYIIQVWLRRNTEVNGATPEQVDHKKRQQMIDEIIYIQNNNTHLPQAPRDLINRDVPSLEAMNTSSIVTYLYCAREIAEKARQQHMDTGQQTIHRYFQRLQVTTNNDSNQIENPGANDPI
jgi:hypothetical protein